MQRRPEINVSVGRVLQNILSYVDGLRLPSRLSMTTKLFIHTSGVGFQTVNYHWNDSLIQFRMPEMC